MSHSSRCDYAQNPVPEDPECYCPGPGDHPLSCGHYPEEEHIYQCAEWHPQAQGDDDV